MTVFLVGCTIGATVDTVVDDVSSVDATTGVDTTTGLCGATDEEGMYKRGGKEWSTAIIVAATKVERAAAIRVAPIPTKKFLIYPNTIAKILKFILCI